GRPPRPLRRTAHARNGSVPRLGRAARYRVADHTARRRRGMDRARRVLSNRSPAGARPRKMADRVGVSDSELIGNARGTPVERYVLDNGRGLRVAILTLGGIVQSLDVPDRHGQSANVVVGFSTFDDSLTRNPFFGA